MSLSSRFAPWLHAAGDLIWPEQCPLCGKWMVANASVATKGPGGAVSSGFSLVHSSCLEAVPRLWAEVPSRPPGASSSGRVIWYWKDDPGFFRLLHAVKYEGRFPLAAVLAEVFADWAAGSLRNWGQGFVIPVPDDPLRLQRRGFSLVGVLASTLSHSSGLPLAEGVLIRRKATRALATLPGDPERRKTLQSVIGVGRLAEIPRTCPLVLVDDQVTTGTTLRSCLELLRGRGHPTLILTLGGALAAPRKL